MMDNALAPGSVREERLENWIASYGDDIVRICFLYLCDAALAEDAAQDTFLKAWRSMDRFEGRNNCTEKTWLMRIAINTCKNYRHSAWLKHMDFSRAVEDLPDSFHTASREDQAFFLDILRLPKKYRQVIILHYYQDVPLAEAADMLHISRSAAYHRLNKALKLLKIVLEGEDFHEAR